MFRQVSVATIFLFISSSYSEVSNSVIDISQDQSKVNFTEVKRHRIIGVIHKATQGASAQGDDKCYKGRRAEAEKEGLLWGAYHFGEGGEPVRQADDFLKFVGNTSGVLLALVLKDTESKMSPDEAEQFVKRINEKTGRYPMLNGGPFFLQPYNKENLNKCSLWICDHTSREAPRLPPNRGSWTLWQYTDKGFVKGIGTSCNRDRYNGSGQQFRSKWPNL